MTVGMGSEGYTIWLTGLPCSGKSTLAKFLQAELEAFGTRAVTLDGDEVRQWLTKGLGFSREDRRENNRRIAHVAKLLTRAGVVAIVAAISPYRDAREEARTIAGQFVEVYVKCPVEVCMKRDVKGMYLKALSGELSNFTGVSDPYEPPTRPEVIVDTDRHSVQDCIQLILDGLVMGNYLRAAGSKASWTPSI